MHNGNCVNMELSAAPLTTYLRPQYSTSCICCKLHSCHPHARDDTDCLMLLCCAGVLCQCPYMRALKEQNDHQGQQSRSKRLNQITSCNCLVYIEYESIDCCRYN